MAAVIINHVKKTFGKTQAVKDVSFTVEAGEIFGLLGPNGAGKTTTIRMMLDIFHPDAGDIAILGGPINEERKSRIGYLPEERGLYPDLQLMDCLTYLATLKGLTQNQARKNIRAYLDELDLASAANKKVKELSKGMQQKAQVIATLAHEPDLMILDEPFSGLDPVNTLRLKEILLRKRKEGKAIIMSTHQMHQVEEICDRLLLINGGRGVLYGTLDEVKTRYADNAIRLWAEGQVRPVSGVTHISNQDGAYLLNLAVGASVQAIMQEILSQPGLIVRRIELATPSLDEIFVSVVTEAEGKNEV